MDYENLGGSGGGGGGGGAPGKAASSSSSAASAINFGDGALFNGEGGLTPLAGIILAGLTLFAFLGLIIVAKK
jgi:hypothetical protein